MTKEKKSRELEKIETQQKVKKILGQGPGQYPPHTKEWADHIKKDLEKDKDG